MQILAIAGNMEQLPTASRSLKDGEPCPKELSLMLLPELGREVCIIGVDGAEAHFYLVEEEVRLLASEHGWHLEESRRAA